MTCIAFIDAAADIFRHRKLGNQPRGTAGRGGIQTVKHLEKHCGPRPAKQHGKTVVNRICPAA